MKRRLALLVVPALLLVGCAGTTPEGDKTSREIYQKRSDDVVIRTEIKKLSDGSEVICTIATGADLSTMDCVINRYDSKD